MSIIVNTARAIMAVLAPLTGTRATGNLTVSSSGGSVVLPDNAFAVPIIDGAVRYDRGVKVWVNPASKAGWTVTATGTSVPAVSNVGGTIQNLAEATSIRWFPPRVGIELVSVVGAGGMTGGTLPTEFASIQQIGFFEEVAPPIGELLAKGSFTRFPAVIVAWEGSGETKPIDRKRYECEEIYGLYVFGSRQDSDPARRVEGLVLCDDVRARLVGRKEVDGYHFSTPRGLHVGPRRVLRNDATAYVFRLQVTASVIVEFTEHRTAQWTEWEHTRLDADTAEDPALRVVTDNEVAMP